MAIRVFGFDVGLGVFFILVLWLIALTLIVIFCRIRTVLSLIFTCVAAVLTAIFLALPRADQQDDDGYPLNKISSSKFEIVNHRLILPRKNDIIGHLSCEHSIGANPPILFGSGPT